MNFLELVKARYSVRNYEERPIEQNKLDYIMECVRLAPSAVNFQPWKFAVITIIRKSKFPQNPKRSVRFSGKRTKRSVQKRKARNTQKAETKVL